MRQAGPGAGCLKHNLFRSDCRLNSRNLTHLKFKGRKNMKNIIFIGNSAATVKAIEEIRKTNKDVAITLVSVDAFYPYERDRLFGYLAKELKEKPDRVLQ